MADTAGNVSIGCVGSRCTGDIQLPDFYIGDVSVQRGCNTGDGVSCLGRAACDGNVAQSTTSAAGKQTDGGVTYHMHIGKGDTVISDRYYYSTLAYQGGL